jgi:hypothetical protein
MRVPLDFTISNISSISAVKKAEKTLISSAFSASNYRNNHFLFLSEKADNPKIDTLKLYDYSL